MSDKSTSTGKEAPKKSKDKYIALKYPIKEAKALTRTTIALYEALLWFQRNHDDCFPGYKKLGEKAKIKSKTTISLHLKVLEKVGLVKKNRRGCRQSNVYQAAMELTEDIITKLNTSYLDIVEGKCQVVSSAAEKPTPAYTVPLFSTPPGSGLAVRVTSSLPRMRYDVPRT